MAQIHDISIDQGSPFTQDFIVKNADNSNKDLTGYSARMQFRLNAGSSTIYLDATTANGKLEIDAPNAICRINLSAADTAALTYNKYVYDIELVDASNKPKRLVQGSVTNILEITR